MWYNPLVTWLLRSPFHRLLDGSILLLTYTGRKSGRAFTLPINYRQFGDRLRLISRQDKPWWKNVRGGAPVQLWLRGQPVAGTATVLSLDDTARLAAIRAVYQGIPDAVALKTLPQAVVVEINLTPALEPA